MSEVDEQPLFVIFALDGPEASELRSQLYDDHRAYINDHGMPIIVEASGPMFAPDDERGESPVGSLFIIRAANHETARQFNRGDPFSRGGVWVSVDIRPFIRRRWRNAL